jgi:CII-binding regulator of phage lambda lysogenization HflD
MNVKLDVNNKLLVVIGAISSLVITLLGILGNEYLAELRSNSDDLTELKSKVILMQKKIDDDQSQWQVLQRQDDKIKEQEVQIEVMKILMKRMNEQQQCNEIVLKVEGELPDVKPKPIPEPPPIDQVEPPVLTGDDDKIFEDLEKKIEELERQEDYEDYRREQMIQQRAFPNQRNFKK